MASDLPSSTVPASGIAQAPRHVFLIVGLTAAGRAFRPSDWADRLAGVMAGFQPPGSGPRSHLHYSPYVVPGVFGVGVPLAGASLAWRDPVLAKIARS